MGSYLLPLTCQILDEGAGQEVMTDALLSVSHANHLVTVMGLHPAYLSCFLRTQNALLQPDGPLPLSWRHYIIIMVREDAILNI